MLVEVLVERQGTLTFFPTKSYAEVASGIFAYRALAQIISARNFLRIARCHKKYENINFPTARSVFIENQLLPTFSISRRNSFVKYIAFTEIRTLRG